MREGFKDMQEMRGNKGGHSQILQSRHDEHFHVDILHADDGQQGYDNGKGNRAMVQKGRKIGRRGK